MLCSKRRKLRRALSADANFSLDIQHRNVGRFEGVRERASVVTSNLELRSNHRAAQNIDFKSKLYKIKIADAERVRNEATTSIEHCTLADRTDGLNGAKEQSQDTRSSARLQAQIGVSYAHNILRDKVTTRYTDAISSLQGEDKTKRSEENVHVKDEANTSPAFSESKTLAWIVGSPRVPPLSHVIGVYYHGAISTGRPLHEELWVDLGGGDRSVRANFKVTPGDGAPLLTSDAQAGTTVANYTVTGSALRVVNGQYRHSGYSDQLPYFTNESNILLLLVKISHLNETPGLCISAKAHGTKTGKEGYLQANAAHTSKNRSLQAPKKNSSLNFRSTCWRQANSESKLIKVLIPRVDRVLVATSANVARAPPLCVDWVQLKCKRRMSACRGRHYYASLTERDTWLKIRTYEKEAQDMRVLTCILKREALLEELHTVVNEVKTNYLSAQLCHDLSADPAALQKTVKGNSASESQSIVDLLDQLRVSGVECVESLASWRDYYSTQCNVAVQSFSDSNCMWIATIESEGRELWRIVPPVRSKFKRYQRGILPAKRARLTKFLGVFHSREAAVWAYEAAKPKVAIECRMSMHDLPQFSERECSAGICVIETRGAGRLSKLEDLVRAQAKTGNFSPAYFYNGEDYLVKMALDLDWLDDCNHLQSHLGINFPFKLNPLVLTPNLKKAMATSVIPSIDPPRATRRGFGSPNEVVNRHFAGALTSWKGELRPGSSFATSSGIERSVNIVDIVRIGRAAAIIEQNKMTSINTRSKSRGKARHVNRQSWTLYEEVQASLITQQPRNWPAEGILEGTFCLAEGKWKGVGIPGKETSSYWFKRRLKEDGEHRKAARNQIALCLRKETALGLVHIQPDRLSALLKVALEMRGAGRIAVDAHRASLLLERRRGAELCCSALQRYARGCHNRSSHTPGKSFLKTAHNIHQQQRNISLTASRAFVNFVVRAASLQIACKLTAPKQIMTRCVGGKRRYCLVYCLHLHVSSKHKEPDVDRCSPMTKVSDPILARDPFTNRLRHDYPPTFALSISYKLQTCTLDRALVVSYDPITQTSCATETDEFAFQTQLIQADAALEKLHTASQCERVHRSRRNVLIAAATTAIGKHKDARSQLEISAMSYEETITRRLKIQSAKLTADLRDFTRRLGVEGPTPDAIDVLQRDDWCQSYDDFENGSDWKALRVKRMLVLQEQKYRKTESIKRLVLCASSVDTTRSWVEVTWCISQKEQAVKAHARSVVSLEQVRAATAHVLSNCSSAVRLLLGHLALQDSLYPSCSYGELWSASRLGSKKERHVQALQFVCRSTSSILVSTGTMDRFNERYILSCRQNPASGVLVLSAERPCNPSGLQEVVIVPSELQKIVKTRGRDDLARLYCELASSRIGGRRLMRYGAVLPVRMRTLANTAMARLGVAGEIAAVLSSELHVDMLGRLHVGQISYRRQREALLRQLYRGNAGNACCKDKPHLPVNSDDLAHVVAFARPCGRWWIDALFAKRSFQRGVLVFREYCRVANQALVVHVHDMWGDLRFECYDAVTGITFSVMITLSTIVRGLLADGDFMALAETLCAVTLCDYPITLIRNLAKRLDLVLPGEDGHAEGRASWEDYPKRKWWRVPMAHEKARLVYHERRLSMFRGPIFRQNTNVCAHSVTLAFLIDANGGYRIALSGGSSSSIALPFSKDMLTLDIPENKLAGLLGGAARSSRFLTSGQKHILGAHQGSPEGSWEVGAGSSPAVPSDIFDFSLLTLERRADFFEFLRRRLAIASEDAAHRRAPGFLEARRKWNAKLAGTALMDFERWLNATDAALRPQSMTKMTRETRRMLIKADRNNQSLQCLALFPLPYDKRQSGTSYSTLWWPSPGLQIKASNTGTSVPYSARIVLDQRGHFFITVSRVSPKEVIANISNDETMLMDQEDTLRRKANALRSLTDAEASIARRSTKTMIILNRANLNETSRKRSALVKIIEKKYRWRIEQRQKISRVKVAVTSLLPHLRIVFDSHFARLLLPVEVEHNFTVSVEDVTVRIKNRNEESWRWWSHFPQVHLITRRAVRIPVQKMLIWARCLLLVPVYVDYTFFRLFETLKRA
mmetsp:Transcript_7542/g.23722  ORF Transcript_7542/g.23722 Transcript_7542/m.23722 type:complete len:2081 (-) Transcript_7542:3199-9441(-)